MKKLFIDYGLLESQIKALLESNVSENVKECLHNLLGEIADTETSDRVIQIVSIEK